MVARIRGTCSNCERPDMSLDSHDRCGSCGSAIFGVPKENWPVVLAAAKEKFQGKPKLAVGRKAKVEGKAPKKAKSGEGVKIIHMDPPGKSLKEEETVKPDPRLFSRYPPPIKFPKHYPVFRFDFTLDSEKDRMLVEKIKQTAQAERRTVPAQVFYMLEKAVSFIETEEKSLMQGFRSLKNITDEERVARSEVTS